MPKPKATTTPVESVKHRDKRANIPTEELRDFVADDEAAPRTLLYPRDPSLDPQLVWKGKDEQDREDLRVPSLPVYIQEVVKSKALIEALRAQAGAKATADQTDFFADVGPKLEFDSLVDFYHHEEDWTNRMILGDSLLVMASLAEKEGLKGKVQMMYFDPPYGIKFGSNWQVSTHKRDVKDGKAEDLTRQPEQIRAFRDTWKLGIHSYLSYLRDRLVLARELLSETGSIFVQIGDENVHVVRSVMDEVFGSENHVATICFQKTGSTDQSLVPQTIDYLLFYGKARDKVKYRQLYQERTKGTLALDRYDSVLDSDGRLRRLSAREVASGEIDGEGHRARLTSMLSARPAGAGDLRSFEVAGVRYGPGSGTFKSDQTGLRRLVRGGRIKAAGKTLQYVRFVDDFAVVPVNDRWESVQIGTGLTYVVQTSTKVIERAILMSTDPGDLVLDPTCGSGTTAYVAEQWGRRWITMDTSRVALALARTRVMAAKYPYYLLSDTPEGARREAELTSRARDGFEPPPTGGDIRKGFVYKRVPHVTLKAIANNEEIDEIHARCQPALEDARRRLNELVKQQWEEWEIPRAPEKGWPGPAKKALDEWWAARRDRQREIDASIARRADTELLYDQPYEDGKRVRVAGPFTVESLSPHRVLSTDEDRPAAEARGQAGDAVADFATMILAHLRKAGVQNTVKAERLSWDWLEPYAGTWIQAEGQYTDADGKARRVAVSIGPEHGTVGPQQVKEAAKEAVQGVGFDVLLVCGFAFDPHVSEEVKRYGRLTVLPVRMNADLAMGDELLKNTGAGNLFTVFGEPDVKLTRDAAGDVVVEIRGVDVYDPTTGQIRSSSTDDIACWFLDTAYTGEAFIVRHAYFTGGDEPYEKLKRALRADIDEAAWASLYSTSSRPFPVPSTGRIAIKVINHYGDEVLKVVEVK